MQVPAGYIALGNNYAFAKLRVGASLMNSEGKEVYFQPGDATADFIFEVETFTDGEKFDDLLIDNWFSDYFE